jgi:putative spermidine/putrescine transport system permease protein
MSATKGPSKLLIAAAVLIGVWLLAPMLVVIPMSLTDRRSLGFPPSGWSLQWYERFFTEEQWHGALLTSVQIALLVTVLATVLGTAAAFALVRGRFPGKGAVNALLLAPLVVPVVIVAIAVFGVYLRWQPSGTVLGFVMAHTALALPFVIITVSASLRGFDRRLELAAANLGASPATTFRKVTLPLILPGVLSGALFAFITSFDEVVVALFLQSPDVRTLPVQMFTSVTREVDPTIAAASTMILVLTTALLVLFAFTRRQEEHVH